MTQFLIVLTAFLFMEFAAWATHKYVMHGFLWYLHEDHHVPSDKQFQKCINQILSKFDWSTFL